MLKLAENSMIMEKIYGTDKAQNGLIQVGRKWIVFYGLYQDPDTGSNYEYRYTFKEKPTLAQVKEVIINQINADIDRKNIVWFRLARYACMVVRRESNSITKAAYDLAFQTSGANLPVCYKFGTDDEPRYHTFSDLQEFTDFYTKALDYVDSTLKEGWKERLY